MSLVSLCHEGRGRELGDSLALPSPNSYFFLPSVYHRPPHPALITISFGSADSSHVLLLVLGDDFDGKFVINDFNIGTYLKTDYDAGSLFPYNPCKYFNGEDCLLVNGEITCGDDDLPPLSDRSDRCDGDDCGPGGGGTDIDWRAENAYLGAKEVDVELSDGSKYSFSGMKQCEGDLRSTEGRNYGNIVCGEGEQWVEDNVQRLLFFETNTDTNPGFFTVDSVQVYDYRGEGYYLKWKTADGAMRYPINGGYDAFYCNEVKFSLAGDIVNQEGSFTAKDFVFGTHRNGLGNTEMRLFNPCGDGRTCSVNDDVLKCNGRVQTDLENLYQESTNQVMSTFAFDDVDTMNTEDTTAPEGASSLGASSPEASSPGASPAALIGVDILTSALACLVFLVTAILI